MKDNWIKNNSVLLVLTLFLLVLLCTVAVITQVIGLFGLPTSFLGAALGAVIMAVVTQLLLKGQTEATEKTERNVKIFELKKTAFTKYINDVWDICTSQHIKDSEFTNLCSNYYKDIAVYLKDEENENFTKYLIEIGECIGQETDESYNKINENVFNIINILIKDLAFGGSIKIEQYENLLKALFRITFKKAITAEIFNVLQPYGCFLEGKSEYFYDGGMEYEYFCFNFKAVKEASYLSPKIVIGPFSIKKENEYQHCGEIDISLFIDMNGDANWPPENENLPSMYHYKCQTKNWYRRIIATKEHVNNSFKELNYHVISTPTGENDEGEYPIDFGNPDELKKKYISTYQKVAQVLAERVGKYFNETTIAEKKLVSGSEPEVTGKEFTIIEFMQKQKIIE